MRGNTSRRTTRRVWGASGAAVVVCAITAVLPGAAASAEPAGVARDSGAGVERISVAADGTQSDGDSTGGAITTDGRRIAFTSSAKNFTPGNAAGSDRVYLRDEPSGQLKQVGSYPIGSPVISGDGQYVALWGLRFRDTKVSLSQVSSGSTIGINCSGLSCSQPSLSADGRYIAHVATFTRSAATREVSLRVDGRLFQTVVGGTQPLTAPPRLDSGRQLDWPPG